MRSGILALQTESLKMNRKVVSGFVFGMSFAITWQKIFDG